MPDSDLLALPLDLLGRERRVARDVRHEVERRSSRLSFITTALMNVRSVPAPAPIAPPIESIVLAICSAVFVVVP